MLRHFYKTAILICIFFANATGIDAQTHNFSYNGALQTWTVPANVSAITIDAVGATGGTGLGFYGSGDVYNIGGNGGRVRCTLSVTPGEVLDIYVGGAGGAAQPATPTAGGFNGGGNSASGIGSGGSGGGATDIRITPYYLTNRVVVAAGGGGGGGQDCAGQSTNPNRGGAGGGLTGGYGYDCSSMGAATAGGGGQPTFGGGGGYIQPFAGTDGLFGIGGNGCSQDDGGGGGGGYYGGGGGASGGGGGGSSYTDPTLATSVIHTPAYNSAGNGSVIITEIPSTGISQVSADNDITIYPNPANDILTIKTGSTKYNTLRITNSIGQVYILQPITTTETSIPVKELPGGIYYISLQGDGAYKVASFVKE